MASLIELRKLLCVPILHFSNKGIPNTQKWTDKKTSCIIWNLPWTSAFRLRFLLSKTIYKVSCDPPSVTKSVWSVRKMPLSLWIGLFLPLCSGTFSSRNENLRPLLKKNIARIANAVQVTLWMSVNHLNRCLCSHCSHCSQCLLVSTSVY